MLGERLILLVNTGSPSSTRVRDVRRYLTHFLTDRRIISLPWIWRQALVRGIIAPLRAPRSAKRYQQIWGEEGALLPVYTHRLAEQIERLSTHPVRVAMRYTPGSVAAALDEAESLGVAEVVVVPLFPHYAMSSYESAVHHVWEQYHHRTRPFVLSAVAPYYAEPLLIDALVEQIAPHVHPNMHLLFSFHGIPHKQAIPYLGIESQDYEQQCIRTTELVMDHPMLSALHLTHEVAFQSRFGSDKWLSPSTHSRLGALPLEGKGAVAVVCPSFVTDCLETVEEIGVVGRQHFIAHGGEKLVLVPCPNDSELMGRAIVALSQPERVTSPDLWIAPQK